MFRHVVHIIFSPNFLHLPHGTPSYKSSRQVKLSSCCERVLQWLAMCTRCRWMIHFPLYTGYSLYQSRPRTGCRAMVRKVRSFPQLLCCGTGNWTLWTHDISDPRHFRPKNVWTLRSRECYVKVMPRKLVDSFFRTPCIIHLHLFIAMPSTVRISRRTLCHWKAGWWGNPTVKIVWS